MDRKHDDRYGNLDRYINEFHEKNRKRLKVSGILLVLLPIVLGLIRWLTDSDKNFFLFVWVICMFALSAYLVSVEYIDHKVRERWKEATDEKHSEHHLP